MTKNNKDDTHSAKISAGNLNEQFSCHNENVKTLCHMKIVLFETYFKQHFTQ